MPPRPSSPRISNPGIVGRPSGADAGATVTRSAFGAPDGSSVTAAVRPGLEDRVDGCPASLPGPSRARRRPDRRRRDSEHGIEQPEVAREPLLIFLPRDGLPVPPAQLQLGRQQLAEQGRPFRLARVGQVGLDPRPSPRAPLRLEGVARPVHALGHGHRQGIGISRARHAHRLLHPLAVADGSALARGPRSDVGNRAVRRPPRCCNVPSGAWRPGGATLRPGPPAAAGTARQSARRGRGSARGRRMARARIPPRRGASILAADRSAGIPYFGRSAVGCAGSLPPIFDRRRLDLDVPLELPGEGPVVEPDRLADALIGPVLARGLDVQGILAGPDRLALVVLAVPDDVVFPGRAGRPRDGGDQVGVVDPAAGPGRGDTSASGRGSTANRAWSP